ncbi:MAG: hypothetical protein OXD46_01270 [Chloroflexi bacterium]|nr:hypothetical protein [Chloroflexota bacterium]
MSGDIIKDIELGRASLSAIGLKAIRLARILNDSQVEQTLLRHSAGDASTESTEKLENAVDTGKAVLHSALKLPGQYEGKWALLAMDRATEVLACRRTFVYDYAIRKHYEIRFSSLAEDVFTRIRSRVDSSIGLAIPDTVKKLTAAYENLRSDNPEDWANAVHSCRRVLQDLADAVFPSQKETRTRNVDGRETEIKLGADRYINRLVAYVEESTESRRFEEIVGSNLRYIGNRLDAVFDAAQKGSHATVGKEEADRYVVYTYLLVGDILSLRQFSGPTNSDVAIESISEPTGELELALNQDSIHQQLEIVQHE